MANKVEIICSVEQCPYHTLEGCGIEEIEVDELPIMNRMAIPTCSTGGHAIEEAVADGETE